MTGRFPGVLHVFDLDGTLHRSTACREIGAALGCRAQVLEMEDQVARGESTTAAFACEVHRLWSQAQRPPLTRQLLERVLERTPWLDSLERVFADIRERGETSAVISMAPSFYVEALRERLGLDHAVGMPFPGIPFNGEPFDAGAALRPSHKVREVRRIYNLLVVADPGLEIVAYGDGADDVPLFRSLPGIPPAYGMSVSVAVNATAPKRSDEHDLRELADVTYDGTSLWPAYLRGRRLLRQPEDPITRFETAS